MARRWKEQFSFTNMSPPSEPVIVDFSIEGKAMSLDITDCIAIACESIVDDIIVNVKALIADSNPEYHDAFRQNIILAGGGSGIRGLGATMEERLADLGEITVHIVEDPVKLGAEGALRLAQEVPEEYWKNLTISDQ